MEYIVEKIGMNRAITNPSTTVTLLRVANTKVCEVEGGKALVAYPENEASSKCVAGQQKGYNLSAEYDRFTTLEVTDAKARDLDETPLNEAKILEISFDTEGRGYSGVMKGHSFAGGPASRGSRFRRRHGPIGNREWPGRVQPGMKMAGRYGSTKVTIKNEVVSYDTGNKILVVKDAVPSYNGAMSKIRIAE